MENTIQSDLIRGHINTIILKALYDGDRYGYDIVREIEQKSSGQYKLKQPTLYSCLKRLEIQGFIRSYWGAKSSGGRRKYFTLTDMGRELFIKNQSEWEYSRTVIDKLISDRSVNLDALPPLSAAESEETAETYDDLTEEKQVCEEASEQAILASLSQEKPSVDAPPAEQATDAPAEEVMQTPPTPSEEPTEQEAAATAYSAPAAKFSDTTAIMDELLRREAENPQDTSYVEQLSAQEYAPSETSSYTAESYFRDFDEEESQSEPATDSYSAPPASFDVYASQAAADHTSPAQEAPVPPADTSDGDTTQSATAASSTDTFLDYHTARLVTSNDSTIEHEYKNILGEFLQESFVARPADSIPPPAPPEETKVEESAYAAPDEPPQLADEPIEPYTSDASVNRKLNTLADEVRELGDSIVIRTHNGEKVKQYTNENYYYSNKMMLVHYAILFGIMLVEILFTAAFVNLVLHAGRKTDAWLYVVSVLFALCFPLTAFVRNYSQPNKRKRINFNLKNSLIYRCIAMAQCLLIIYCVNVIAKMPLGFSLDYVTSLLLPGLLSTCLPVSSIIFYSLFKSKRFAVEQ